MRGLLDSALAAMAARPSGSACLERGLVGDIVWPHDPRRTGAKNDWRIPKGRFSYRVRAALGVAARVFGRRQDFGVAR